MTSVDRLGFSLRLKTANGVKGARINFLREVATPQDTRAVLVEMVRRPKQAADGQRHRGSHFEFPWQLITYMGRDWRSKRSCEPSAIFFHHSFFNL